MDPDLAYEAAEGKAAAQPGRTSALPSGAQFTELKAEEIKAHKPHGIDVLQRVLARDLAAHRFAGRSYLRPALTRLSPEARLQKLGKGATASVRAGGRREKLPFPLLCRFFPPLIKRKGGLQPYS